MGLTEVGAALARGEWQRALDQLDACGALAGSAEGLELRARAAYANGDFEKSVAAWEDLHALQAAEGDTAAAARAAAMVAMYLMIDTGLMAPVRGWLGRAERLLAGHAECSVHAVIAMVRTYERFMCGDLGGTRTQASRAIDLGERHGVVPAVAIGQVAEARVRIVSADVPGGLALLDEVATRLMSGEVDALTTGMVYCELICAAQGLALHERASEWTEVMQRWRQGAAYGGIHGRCRVHRAEILRMTGPCDEAEEEEALAACAELRPWMRREFGWPLVELGNIRLRRGDLPGAEEAFLGAHARAWFPQPGLALLRLAQGDGATALEMITDAVEHPLDIPSKERPPSGDLRLAPLLDASAALARARVLLLDGDLGGAIESAGTAVCHWADLGAPYDTATARLVLGEAHHRSGHRDQARMEWHAACSAYAAFGATRSAERAASLLAGDPAPAPARGLSPTPATFRGEDGSRIATFGGRTVTLPDLTGFRHLARLLAEPGREFHVLDLVAVERGALPTTSAVPPELTTGGDSGLPVLDDESRRLTEVEEDIDEAALTNDLVRQELAERDRDYLVAELAGAFGLGGRARTVGGTAERARTSVTRSLRYAVARLAERHPMLGGHLDRTVDTGTYCSYTPDPSAPVTWDVGPPRQRP